MTERQSKFSKFFYEIKRRKVVRVIIVYATTAFILLQLVIVLIDTLPFLPHWLDTLVTILLIVGLPLAVILAWAFYMTPKYERSKEKQSDDKSDVELLLLNREPKEKSILVLPFENLSSDPEQEYFSDGLTEELTADLSHYSELLVISRSSAMTFKNTKQTIKDIADKVNVRYILEGSVRKSNDRIRITVQLIDAQNDIHLWAKKYNGILEDIFDIQEKVSSSIARELNAKIGNQEGLDQPVNTIHDVKVFELYYRAAREILKQTEDSINKATKMLDDAINEMGEHALIYTCKAWGMWNLANLGIRQEENLLMAEENLNLALKIDPYFPKAHAILGWIYLPQDINISKSHLQKALSFDSNEESALQGIVVLYSTIGKTSDSLLYFKKLQKTDPLNYLTLWLSGGLAFYNGEFSNAYLEWKKIFDSGSRESSTIFYLALVMLYLENTDRVLEFINKNMKHDSNYSFDRLLRILKFALENEKEKIFNELDKDFTKICEKDYSYSHHISTFFAICNLKEESIAWLEKAIEAGFINYPMISKKDSLLENIRGEDRFDELVKIAESQWSEF